MLPDDKGEAHVKRRNNPVDIPSYLLSDQIPHRYNLYAIVNHTGGHYVSLVKNDENSLWYLFDDGKVGIFDFDKLNVSYLYFLFLESTALSDCLCSPAVVNKSFLSFSLSENSKQRVIKIRRKNI